MKNIKYIAVVALFLAIFAGNISVASAQTSSSTLTSQIQALLLQVKSLQSQLSALENQRSQLNTQLKQSLQLTRSLSLGMTSDDIKILQQMLASDPTIYPEGKITGYFGSLTEKAVKKFQKKHGIEQLGNVGPKTLAKINALLKEGKLFYNGSIIVASSTSSVKIEDNDDNDDDQNKHGAKITLCHKPDGNPQTITVGASSIIAHIKHGDKLGACGTTLVTPTTDTTAPIISNLTAVPAATTTVVSLTTNENTTGTLWYAPTTPVSTSSALKIEDNVLKMSRSFNISGLASSTIYYYLVGVKDTAGNSATTTEHSFTTLAN